MREASCLAGAKELGNIKKHMLDSLDADERIFVNAIDERIENLINEKDNKFLNLDELVKLRKIEEKYRHLKPFTFRFNPMVKIPRVARNRTAFIIWTVWRSNHILGDHEDLNAAVLAAANILDKHSPPYPYPSEAKEEAVRTFITKMEMTGGNLGSGYSDSSSFWNERIFPYLEGVREFKWQMEL